MTINLVSQCWIAEDTISLHSWTSNKVLPVKRRGIYRFIETKLGSGLAARRSRDKSRNCLTSMQRLFLLTDSPQPWRRTKEEDSARSLISEIIERVHARREDQSPETPFGREIFEALQDSASSPKSSSRSPKDLSHLSKFLSKDIKPTRSESG